MAGADSGTRCSRPAFMRSAGTVYSLPTIFTSIETIDKQQATLEAQLAAAAPQLSIDVHAGGDGRVNLGGAAVTGPYGGPLVDLARIEIEGIATIVVTPPLGDVKAAEAKRRRLATDLQAALRKVGAETVAEATAAMTLRRDLETKLRGVQAELEALGIRDGDAPTLIASLAAHLINGIRPLRPWSFSPSVLR